MFESFDFNKLFIGDVLDMIDEYCFASFNTPITENSSFTVDFLNKYNDETLGRVVRVSLAFYLYEAHYPVDHRGETIYDDGCYASESCEVTSVFYLYPDQGYSVLADTSDNIKVETVYDPNSSQHNEIRVEYENKMTSVKESVRSELFPKFLAEIKLSPL